MRYLIIFIILICVVLVLATPSHTFEPLLRVRNNSILEGALSSISHLTMNNENNDDLAIVGRNSNKVPFLSHQEKNTHLINQRDGLFAPAINYGVGIEPFSVFSADLDNDGDNDLAVANFTSDNVTILFNNGAGVFLTATSYSVGDGPRSIFSADLDNDGDYDLATANDYSDDISVLKNNGDGTFVAAVTYSAGGACWYIDGADLDNDGDNDLAVANYDTDDVSVLLNQGDGTFATAVNYNAGDGPRGISCADFDNDGNIDLAVGNWNSNNISILMNQGGVTFAAPVNYSVGTWPWTVYSADLDNDGDYDLSVVDSGSDSLSVLLNQGDGLFTTTVYYSVESTPLSVFSADYDNDGDNDLAVANQNSANISILLNNGDGIFQSEGNYSVGVRPRSVFSADLDNDGDYDLAVANRNTNNVSILFNLTFCTDSDDDDICNIVDNCIYTYNPGQEDTDGDGIGDACDATYDVVATDSADIYDVITTDIDRDNYTDVIYVGNSALGLFIAYGTPDDTLEDPVSYLDITHADLTTGFLNTDTLPDIITATSAYTYLLINNGSRAFTIDSIANSKNRSIQPVVATGNFNADRYLDIFVGPHTVYYGDGTGAITGSNTYTFSASAANATDFNRDGFDDLLIVENDSAKIMINDQAGGFSEASALYAGTGIYSVSPSNVVMDVNYDGLYDMVVVTPDIDSSGQSVVKVAIGDGFGGMTQTDTI